MRVLAKSLLVLVLLSAVPAFAQSQPPARVGRVSLISGTLAFYGPGDTEWSAAQVNLPVAAGGWFATDGQSRAQLRIGPNSINLANDSQLNFADLRSKVMQITLTQGRVDLHLRQPAWRKGETVEIDVPRGGVWLSQPGLYDITAGTPDQPTRIMVFEGSARFAGGGVDMTVQAGDQLILSGNDTLTAAVERAAPDEFVEWCRAHDYRNDRVAAARHVSPAMTGFEELEAYGEWNRAPGYGAVWYPRSLAAGWEPYRQGHWAWMEPWGWNWVDEEPWGFAPFHYGRWARITNRWGWVPGEFVAEPVYAPALVAFIPTEAFEGVGAYGGSPVGWFPLAPGEVFWPSYTRDPTYIRNVNITNVNITRINNITTAMVTQPNMAGPPPQVLNQQFANRGAATVVPAQAFVNSSPVAQAAVAVPSPMLQRAAVSVGPPSVVARPAGTSAATEPGRAGPPGQPGQATPPAPGVAIAPTPGRAPTGQATAAAPPPPAPPNFSQLGPAPRVGPAAAQKAQQTPTPGPATPAPAAQGTPPAATPGHPPGQQTPTPGPATPAPAAQGTAPAAIPGRPPGPPDFSHLAPARVSPGAPGQNAQRPPGPAGAPSSAHATPPGPPQPGPGTAPQHLQQAAPQPPPPQHQQQAAPQPLPQHQQQAAPQPLPQHQQQAAPQPPPQHLQQAAPQPPPQHLQQAAPQPPAQHQQQAAPQPPAQHQQQAAPQPPPQHQQQAAPQPPPQHQQQAAPQPPPQHQQQAAPQPPPQHQQQAAPQPPPPQQQPAQHQQQQQARPCGHPGEPACPK